MKKSFIVIGLGTFGMSVAKSLSELKCDIVAIDSDSDKVAKISKFVENSVICDSTNKDALLELGVKNADEAIIDVGKNLQTLVLTVINLKELGIEKICVKVNDKENVRILEKLGATDFVYPEEEFGQDYAKKVAKSNKFDDYFCIEKDFGITSFTLKEDFKTISLMDLNSTNKYGILIIAISRSGKMFIPNATDEIMASDILYVIGNYDKTLKFEHDLNA